MGATISSIRTVVILLCLEFCHAINVVFVWLKTTGASGVDEDRVLSQDGFSWLGYFGRSMYKFLDVCSLKLHLFITTNHQKAKRYESAVRLTFSTNPTSYTAFVRLAPRSSRSQPTLRQVVLQVCRALSVGLS